MGRCGRAAGLSDADGRRRSAQLLQVPGIRNHRPVAQHDLEAGMRRAQQGVVLFVSLIILVAMTLAGIALMRSVDTNVLIAGNLAFRQANTMYADTGVEAARAWLSANTASLENNQPGGALHYWANYQPGLNFLGTAVAPDVNYNWDQAATFAAPDPAYTISYVIHRLCGGAGG